MRCGGRGGRKEGSSIGWRWDSVAPRKPLVLPMTSLRKKEKRHGGGEVGGGRRRRHDRRVVAEAVFRSLLLDFFF